MLRRVAVAVLALVCAAPALYAQTADEIVAKNIEAHGGAAKLKSIQSMKATGKMEIGPGMQAPVVAYQTRPNNMRSEFTFQGMTGVQTYDGAKNEGWQIMPFMGKKDPEVVSADERDELADGADMDGQLMDYAKKGNKVEFLGKDKLEGTDVYKLKVTLKDGSIQTWYIDTDSNLEVRVESERVVRGTTHKTIRVIGDYQQVDGVAVPMSMEMSDADHPDQKMKMTLEKVQFNVPVDASIFKMPPKTEASTKGADSAEPKPAPGDKKPDEAPKAQTPRN